HPRRPRRIGLAGGGARQDQIALAALRSRRRSCHWTPPTKLSQPRLSRLAEQKVGRLAPPGVVDATGPVVVFRSLQYGQSLWLRQRFVKRGAETGGHDAVALGDGHKNGAAERRQVGDAVVAVAQQPLHRQPRIVVRPDVLEPIPWRNEEQPRYLVALAHAGRSGHGGSQGFSDDEQRCAIE